MVPLGPVAKRSPILGYNHNVRYRGLVWHVQTEDSGLANPHLFTHLFYGGVIVSTRKLVYDAGADEGAIKALMQAQHKAVMKDLKRGHFDDKIDQYLGGTAGLLPRGNSENNEFDATTPIPKPAPGELDEPPAAPEPPALPEVRFKPSTRPPQATPPAPTPIALELDRESSAPEIQLELGDDDSNRRRAHDTEVNVPERAGESAGAPVEEDPVEDFGDLGLTRPTAMPDHMPRVPELPVPPPVPPPPKRITAERAAIPASALPPVRPPTGPRPSITAPQVVARPLAPEARTRPESDAVEVYAPAPPSAEPPPGAMPERPGQYAQHRRGQSSAVPPDVVKGRERPTSSQHPPMGRPITAAPPTRPVPPVSTSAPGSGPIPSVIRHDPASAGGSAASRPPPVPPPRPNVTGSGGVVMTRPAVIVGAPNKAATGTPTTQRIRKAREDEGRGFGQGLISEKSLDEVILAYLSEDADDK